MKSTLYTHYTTKIYLILCTLDTYTQKIGQILRSTTGDFVTQYFRSYKVIQKNLLLIMQHVHNQYLNKENILMNTIYTEFRRSNTELTFGQTCLYTYTYKYLTQTCTFQSKPTTPPSSMQVHNISCTILQIIISRMWNRTAQ